MLLNDIRRALGLSGLLLWAGPALAQKSPPACIPHHEKSQELKIAGKLVESKQELLACASDAACPSVIQSECDQMLEALKPDIPSLVFAARDADGNDTIEVKVYSGDQLVMGKLQVKGYELDPGEYRFKFVAADGTAKEQSIVVREGEQNRRIFVDFQKEAPVTGTALPSSALPPPSNAGAWKRPVGFTMIGLGAVGIGVGSYFGLKAKSKNDDARPHCTTDNHCDATGVDLVNQAKTSATISTIGFAAGVGLAALGTVFVVTAPSGEPEDTAVRFTPAVGPGFAGAAVSGRFTW
jgi:hypothetical protein